MPNGGQPEWTKVHEAGRFATLLLDLCRPDPYDGQDGPSCVLEYVQKLTHTRHRRSDDVVGQEDSKRFSTDHGTGAHDCVPKPERFPLANICQRSQLGDCLDLGELVCFPSFVQVLLELEGRIETVLDGPLVPARDEGDVVEPRFNRLLHDVVAGAWWTKVH